MTARSPDPVSSSSSFTAALSALLPELRRKALSLTKNPSRADDLLQDTLERALVHQTQFRQGSNLRAWLARIMTNRFISQARRQMTERRVLERAAHDPNGWTRRECSVQVHRLPPSLDRALGALPPRLRTAVTLVDLEDGTYRDAAEAQGVPIGTVMSRLHRGRARLKQEISRARVVPGLPEAGASSGTTSAPGHSGDRISVAA